MEIKQNKLILKFHVTDKFQNIYSDITNIFCREENNIEILSDIFRGDDFDIGNMFFIPLKDKEKMACFIKEIIKQFSKNEYNISFFVEEYREKCTFIKQNVIHDNRYLLMGAISINRGINAHIHYIDCNKIQNMLFELSTFKQNLIEYEIKTAVSSYDLMYKNRDKKKIINSDDLLFEVSSNVAGYIFHEIIGHLLEVDFYTLPNIWIKYKYEETIPSWLTITHDSGPSPESLGLGKYDDNGDMFVDNILIENGKVRNCISRGNYRKESVMFSTLPRMRTINILSNKYETAENYINDNSIYIHSIKVGLVNPYTGNFQLIGMNGYFLRDKNISTNTFNIAGNVNDLMRNIKTSIGDNKYCTGTCLKNNQKIIVGMNSPGLIFSSQNLRITENER